LRELPRPELFRKEPGATDVIALGNDTMSTARKLRPLSAIKCHKCSYLVALSTTERLPAEFTVRCPNCSHRGFYRTGEIRGIDAEQDLPGEPSSSAPGNSLRNASKKAS
jgi:DNA-directed RNA polymerase subunit RPC12/RpoP